MDSTAASSSGNRSGTSDESAYQRTLRNATRSGPCAPPVFVGSAPVGTRVWSCPVTALAYAGLKARLFELSQSDITDSSEEEDGEEYGQADSARGRAARAAREARFARRAKFRQMYAVFREVYKGGWADTLRPLPRGVRPCRVSEVLFEEVVGDLRGNEVGSGAFLETPFTSVYVGDDGIGTERVDVPAVPIRPSFSSLRMMYGRYFATDRVSLLHGKGRGVHEIGEAAPRNAHHLFRDVERSVCLAWRSPAVGRGCDLCIIAACLSEQYRRHHGVHGFRRVPRYVRLALRGEQDGSHVVCEGATHVLVRSPQTATLSPH